MTPSAFPRTAELGSALLRPPASDECETLAAALADMQPWSTMGISAEGLAAFLKSDDSSAHRYAILQDDVLAGIASVRFPWLKGPYIELLAILPGLQRRGHGQRLLSFVEDEAMRLDARNVWVCASRFNSGAAQFYKRHGFVEVATLPDLVADDFTETLFRKMLT